MIEVEHGCRAVIVVFQFGSTFDVVRDKELVGDIDNRLQGWEHVHEFLLHGDIFMRLFELKVDANSSGVGVVLITIALAEDYVMIQVW